MNGEMANNPVIYRGKINDDDSRKLLHIWIYLYLEPAKDHQEISQAIRKHNSLLEEMDWWIPINEWVTKRHGTSV